MKRWILMKKSTPRNGACNIVADILAVAGAAAITIGVSLMSTAAGWISAGILLIAAAVIWSKGSDSG